MDDNPINVNELRKKLENQDRMTQVEQVTETILEKLGATSERTPKSSKEIISYYQSLASANTDLPEIPEGTFLVNLSKLASKQGSKINCQGRRQGYYLEQLVEELEEIEKNEQKVEPAPQDCTERFYEKHLYPTLKKWLFEKDFDRVADTSSGKANGKWGNPDLVGFRIEDIYGRPEIEITTIEVKLTDENWKQWIFEAVAHTRFADRSYFAFMHPDNLVNKLDSTGIKLYAEHFNVGILVIPVKGDDYKRLKSKETVKFTHLEVQEYYPAPQTRTHIKFRKDFLAGLGLLELKQLYNFGEEIETAQAQ